MCCAVLFAFAQTTLVTISGQVTDDVTGDPFPYHPVNIYCSDSFAFSYYNTVNTDINGNYIDSIDVPTGQPITFKVSTYDCNQSIQIVYVYTDSPPMIANFSICTGCQADFNILQDTTNYGWNFYFIDNSNGFNTSWTWFFGDGDTSDMQSPYHTYYTVGSFYVCLTIQDDYGCEDTFCDTLIIDSSNYVYTECSASFYLLPPGTLDTLDTSLYLYYGWNPYIFIDNSSGFNTSWFWSFGDGDTSYLQSPTHTYYAVGSYIVCLTVQDDLGCEDTFCDSLIVDSSAYKECNASFNYNISNIFTVNFLGSSNNPYATYDWDFGDGSYANNTQYPSHIYDTAGNFTVCLTIYDSLGCNDTYCHLVDITTFFNISGSVLSSISDSVSGPGIVYLIEYDSTTNMLTAIDTTNFNYNYYFFTNVDTGSYLVKAALDSLSIYYSDYLPTYYGDVLFWDDATYIFLYSDVSYIIIYLIQGNNPGGPGFIGGDVSQGANKLMPGDPIADVEILLLNMDDSPVTYTYTDASGNFEFNNIAYGTYQVYTEITGKITYPVIITIDSINPSVSNINILVNEDDIIASTAHNDVISQSYQNVIIYPNPNNGIFTISNFGLADVYKLEIIALKGKIVYSDVIRLDKNDTKEININNLSKGIYFLKIQTDKCVEYRKIIVL